MLEVMRWPCLASMAWLGCGPAVATDSADGDGGASATTDGSDDVDDDGASTSDGGSGPIDTGEVETADPDGSSGGPTTATCGADSPQQPLAVLTGTRRASILFADGSLLDLDAPDLADATTTTVDARADRIAIAVTASAFENGASHYGSVLALFDTTGAPLWTRAEPDVLVGSLYVADDGAIAATRTLEDGSQRFALFVDGDIAGTVEGFFPHGPRGADGHVPGRISNDDGATLPGWLRPDAVTVQAVSSTIVDAWFVPDDGAFVYVTPGKSSPWLVRESPSRPAFDVLSVLAGAPTLRISRSSSAQWLLVEVLDDAGESQGWVRVSVDDGTAEAIELAPPAGFTEFACYWPNPVIDSRGQVLAPLRDASIAQVQRLDPSTGTWQPIGRAVTTVDAVDVTVHGDSYLVQARGPNTTFCQPEVFEPAEGALVGTSLQLVRPVDDVEYVLPSDLAWTSVRNDGACAALVGAETITLLDVAEGSEMVLAGFTGVHWWST